MGTLFTLQQFASNVTPSSVTSYLSMGSSTWLSAWWIGINSNYLLRVIFNIYFAYVYIIMRNQAKPHTPRQGQLPGALYNVRVCRAWFWECEGACGDPQGPPASERTGLRPEAPQARRHLLRQGRQQVLHSFHGWVCRSLLISVIVWLLTYQTRTGADASIVRRSQEYFVGKNGSSHDFLLTDITYSTIIYLYVQNQRMKHWYFRLSLAPSWLRSGHVEACPVCSICVRPLVLLAHGDGDYWHCIRDAGQVQDWPKDSSCSS